MIPTSLLDFSYEETFATLDANGPFTVLDLKDVDNTWATRSRPSSPTETPDSSSKDTPSTRSPTFRRTTTSRLCSTWTCPMLG